jgi:integrase
MASVPGPRVRPPTDNGRPRRLDDSEPDLLNQQLWGGSLFARTPRFFVAPDHAHILAGEQLLGKAMTEEHWRKLHSTFRSLSAMRDDWGALGRKLDWATTIVLWIAAHQQRGLLASSLRAYTNCAVSVLKRTGVDLSGDAMIRDLRRALDKCGARRPTRQAKAMVPADWVATLRGEGRADVRLVLAIMWCAAGRYADVAGLQFGDITPIDGTSYAIRFGGKSDPFAEKAAVGVRMPPSVAASLNATIAQQGAGKLFPKVSYGDVISSVRRVSKEYGAHSLRRGALTALLRAGVDPSHILMLSRHTTVAALIRYLPVADLPQTRESLRLSEKLCPSTDP